MCSERVSSNLTDVANVEIATLPVDGSNRLRVGDDFPRVMKARVGRSPRLQAAESLGTGYGRCKSEE